MFGLSSYMLPASLLLAQFVLQRNYLDPSSCPKIRSIMSFQFFIRCNRIFYKTPLLASEFLPHLNSTAIRFHYTQTLTVGNSPTPHFCPGIAVFITSKLDNRHLRTSVSPSSSYVRKLSVCSPIRFARQSPAGSARRFFRQHFPSCRSPFRLILRSVDFFHTR